MRKPRHHWHLDQALLVLLIMIGAVVSTVLDVQAITAAMASGRYGLDGIATVAPAPLPPPPPRASGSTSKRADATVVARLAR
ncbi:MAG TPA: hypothetical protein VL624_15900 [Caldimonas sp.]|jgi:hypothetical protein|nr:hypothetical protein [Caldimonas sp.]